MASCALVGGGSPRDFHSRRRKTLKLVLILSSGVIGDGIASGRPEKGPLRGVRVQPPYRGGKGAFPGLLGAAQGLLDLVGVDLAPPDNRFLSVLTRLTKDIIKLHTVDSLLEGAIGYRACPHHLSGYRSLHTSLYSTSLWSRRLGFGHRRGFLRRSREATSAPGHLGRACFLPLAAAIHRGCRTGSLATRGCFFTSP